MRRPLVLGVLALVLVLAGCQTVTFQGLQVVTSGPTYTKLKDFSITIADPHLFGGLAPMGQPDQKIMDYIKKEIESQGGNGAIDVEIDYGYTTLDFVLNMLTWNVYSPRTITITGTVVKYR
jgi:hypothetical protein